MWIGHRERPNEILIKNPALMGPAGRAAAALPGGHVEGFGDTFAAHFRAVYADIAAGRPAARPAYPTFADGHDEMLVNDAIAESARLGRWVDVVRDPVPGRTRRRGRHVLMRLGLLTAPFPETPLARRRRLDGRQRLREHRDRLLAADRAGRAGATPGTSHIDVANLSAGEASELAGGIRAEGPDDLGARLLPEPAPPRSRASRRRSSAISAT